MQSQVSGAPSSPQSPNTKPKKFNIKITRSMKDLIADANSSKKVVPEIEQQIEPSEPRVPISEKLKSKKPQQVLQPIKFGGIQPPPPSASPNDKMKPQTPLSQKRAKSPSSRSIKKEGSSSLLSRPSSAKSPRPRNSSSFVDNSNSQEEGTFDDSNNYGGDDELLIGPGEGSGHTTTSSRNSSSPRKSLKRRKDDENLGEDFEATPWCPPSIEKAEKYRQDNIFRQGNTRIDSVDIVNAEDLSLGVTLYFQFAMNMALCLFIMSLLSLPALIFTFHGFGISIDDQDTFGFYHYTLGNLGYFDKTLANYQSISQCVTPKYTSINNEPNNNNYNMTCIHFNGYELSFADTATYLTIFEVLQITVFLLGIVRLYIILLQKTTKACTTEISVADYSIMITKLPPDASEKELLEHFSSLYRLDAKDWKGRPIVSDAKPVELTGNSGLSSIYQGTWVAECIIHKSIGSFISSFKSKQHLMENMYRYRAKMKMYSAVTPHAHGFSLVHYELAEQQMLKIALEIDRLTEQNIVKTGLKLLIDPEEEMEDANNDIEEGGVTLMSKKQRKLLFPDKEDKSNVIDHRVNNPQSIYYHIDAPTCAAFIIFQYSESFARCLEDYEPYSYFGFNSFFYPKKLQFQNHDIMVVRAPEPDQVIWENLEVPFSQKFYLRLRTAVIAFFLILICFIFILQASIYKQSFAESKPDLSLCNNMIPELYVNASSDVSFASISLMIPPTKPEKQYYNNLCFTVVPDSFYAIYVYNHNFSHPVAKYDVNSCSFQSSIANNISSYGLCPALGANRFCPCITTTSQEKCESPSCSRRSIQEKCESFPASVLGACYCADRISEFIQSGSTEGIATRQCQQFFSSYSLSTGLTYASVFATTIVNVLTRYALKLLTKYEAYTSLDEFQASIMSKIFFSNFATMAILVLVAYGNGQSENSFLSTFHLFRGPYDDFSPQWYGNVGLYLVTTFILQSFSPLFANLFKYYIEKPLLRCYHFPRVR
jgi:hypothetical protein